MAACAEDGSANTRAVPTSVSTGRSRRAIGMAGEPIGVLIREASPAVRTAAGLSSPAGAFLGLAEKLSGLVGVGQDLKPAHLFVAAEAPDVDDGHLGALIALLDVRMSEHDYRVAVLIELVRAQRELVPGADGLLNSLESLVPALARTTTRQLLRIAALPREVVSPVGQRALNVPLRELVVALAQQVGLAGHLEMPPSGSRLRGTRSERG